MYDEGARHHHQHQKYQDKSGRSSKYSDVLDGSCEIQLNGGDTRHHNHHQDDQDDQ